MCYFPQINAFLPQLTGSYHTWSNFNKSISIYLSSQQCWLIFQFHVYLTVFCYLQIFFSKNVNQYQRLTRILSGWYKRSEQSEDDLREQIEPLLKGHKHLLEEFSRFFPQDKPPDRYMQGSANIMFYANLMT